MDEETFFQYRIGFRQVMAEKSLGEIMASKGVFQKLILMDDRQLQLLIDDLLLLEDYKIKHPTTNEEFNRIAEGFYR